MNFLETEEVVKDYSGHRALDKVSIHVPQGEIFGLLGPNGAGKTTLIRIINRITAPDSGSVIFDGHLSRPEDIYQIGYLPEERGLYKKMKVGEQAIYLAQLKGLSYSEAKKRLTTWFKKFEIMSWWDRKVEELSKGMQQKVQFIVTIIHEPKLLIFDEPFSGFDPVNTEQLKKEILELKDKGHTIIFSTHNMESVEEICDNIALINTSHVVLAGAVPEVRSRFKSDRYTVKIHADNQTQLDLPEFAEKIEIHTDRLTSGFAELSIRKRMEMTNSEILTLLADRFDIVEFHEELPSMNDIFIQTVSNPNNKENHE